MDVSIFIAKIIGLVYVVIGLGMFLNGKYYKKMVDSMMKESSVWYFGGIVALIIGFLIVSVHNVWEFSWVVLVTIIGWMAFLKGLLLLMAPKWMMSMGMGIFKKFKSFSILGIIIVIVGLIFSYFGFLMA